MSSKPDHKKSASDALKALSAQRTPPPAFATPAATALLTKNPTKAATVQHTKPRQKNDRITLRLKPDDDPILEKIRTFLFTNKRPTDNETLVIRAALRLLTLDDTLLKVIDELEAQDGRRQPRRIISG